MMGINTIQPGTVNVLIGPNGSGKSTFLREICADFIAGGHNVIAVAPTIHDRFRKMPHRGLKFYGARQGRQAASRVISSALAKTSLDNPQVLKNLTRALDYTKFDPCIGIKLSNLNPDKYADLAEQIPNRESEALRAALYKWENQIGEGGIAKLQMDSFSFRELDDLSFATIALYEKSLYRSRIASKIEYFLYRNGVPIRLLDACSGEIVFITTVAFISTQIERHSVIAIDEPDTSLHPTWQQSYVRTLLDLFHHYEPRILISTHSPIIISGAELADDAVEVYEIESGKVRKFDHAKLSLEEMYDRLFGLITPKNHYLSQRAVSLLNALNDGSRHIEGVIAEFEELKGRSYDESQREVISKFEEIARNMGTSNSGVES